MKKNIETAIIYLQKEKNQGATRKAWLLILNKINSYL